MYMYVGPAFHVVMICDWEIRSYHMFFVPFVFYVLCWNWSSFFILFHDSKLPSTKRRDRSAKTRQSINSTSTNSLSFIKAKTRCLRSNLRTEKTHSDILGDVVVPKYSSSLQNFVVQEVTEPAAVSLNTMIIEKEGEMQY